jgi:hypothetical protein
MSHEPPQALTLNAPSTSEPKSPLRSPAGRPRALGGRGNKDFLTYDDAICQSQLGVVELGRWVFQLQVNHAVPFVPFIIT